MIKDKIKKDHPHKHQDCNFGITDFNLTKREVKENAEDAATRNKPSHGKGGGTPPPPPPPPPSPSGGCILLTFGGFTVTGTAWNYAGDIVCAAANLSSTEIDEIIANIQNAYAPFNVVVTADETIFNSYPVGKRTRVIFTETWEFYGQAGGTSFIGSFHDGSDNPCFVFTSLLNYVLRRLWTAGTHEAGHTINLLHQSAYDTNCIKTDEYNHGTATECPFMGFPYEDWKTPQFWIGANPYGCTNIQHDHDMIAAVVGLKV